MTLSFRQSPLPLALALAVIALPMFSARAQSPQAAAPQQNESAEAPPTPLQEAMQTMGGTFRGLRRALNSPDPAKKDEYLAALQVLQAAAIKAKDQVPPTIVDFPEAERPGRLTEFRTGIAQAIETMLQLERAILSDDWEKTGALAQKLADEQREGHRVFRPKEER